MSLPVAGTTWNDAKGMTKGDLKKIRHVKLVAEPDNDHDTQAIAVLFASKDGKWLKLGDVPATLLPFAHKSRWTERHWFIGETGTFRPRAPNLSKKDEVFCRLQSTRDQIVRSLQNDATLFTGTELVTIRYEKTNGAIVWRDVVPLLDTGGTPWRDASGFRATDGTTNQLGLPMPERFLYAAILDARTSAPARRRVAAAEMGRLVDELGC
jgi:hypothetical protein